MEFAQRRSRSEYAVLAAKPSVEANSLKRTYSMTVYVNDKAGETAAVDIAALHSELALPDMVAIALDYAVVPRAEWAERRLSEGDKLVIIKVACGG